MTPADRPWRVLIGGVGYRFQRDASFGLSVTDALAETEPPAGVEVEDLGYGAILVAHDLAAESPPFERVVLVASAVRGRSPGRLYRRRWRHPRRSAEEIQARIREAGAGVIDLDHLLVIGSYLGSLPDDVRMLELEPVDVAGGEGLSPTAEALLPDAIRMARREALAGRSREVRRPAVPDPDPVS